MDPSSSKRKRDPDSLDEVSSCKRPKTDVFVNYSFEDTGKSFVSHLKGGLRRNGFAVSDRTMLPIGQDETSELLKAIQDSEICLVVLSTNYAFSIKCLDELALIMNCQRKVFPIFFNVDPSHVRSQQEGSFMEAFLEHDTNFDPERIQKWRQALKDAGQLSGLTFQNGVDEAEFILRIVEELEKMQSPQDLHVTDHPVGIGSRAEELISKLRLDCKDQVLVVGVFGIGGIGKTTIVKATYNRIAAKFDVSCFLAVADICGRQNWKVKLQKMLISFLTKNFKHPITHSHNDGVTKIRKLIGDRKILLVLDDVDKFQQLEELGINPAWFYNGSRIIVTTRDRQSLGYIPYASYHTTLLNRRESLTLFIRVMFAREDTDNTKFIEEVVSRAGGLPLVLKVWSRHFNQYKKEQWPSILETLKRIPHGDVQKQLQLSYDSLPIRSKKFFLDIVYFFAFYEKELVVKVLQDEDSGFFPDIEIQNLVDKGLVEINSYDQVSMHKAIREMGQEVVRQENEDEPGQRTRLMGFRDVVRVLRDCSGTESVESILLNDWKIKEPVTVQVEAFKKMSNLRFIQLWDYVPYYLQWSSSSSSNDDMSSFSFKKLKYLEWDFFPLKCLDNIDMGNVVVIKLRFSKLEKLWEGLKESFFTKDEALFMSLSGEEVPDWCSYRSNENVLSFVAPIRHVDNKICGVIICATLATDFNEYGPPTMLNKTKETSHRFNSPECEYANDQSSPMFIVFYPLNDKTLVVEAGDTVVLQFDKDKVSSCGLLLIYEDDLSDDDSTLLIQKQPSETPFKLTVTSSETTVAAAASITQLYDDSIYPFPLQDKEIIYYNFLPDNLSN